MKDIIINNSNCNEYWILTTPGKEYTIWYRKSGYDKVEDCFNDFKSRCHGYYK